MCIFCKAVVHNDHVARWASHFRACSKIPFADRAEYDFFANNDSTMTNAKHKRQKLISIKPEQEVFRNDPMGLLLKVAIGDILPPTSTAMKEEQEVKVPSSSSITSMNRDNDLVVVCNKAFKEGLESGILLLDKFTKSMIEKMSSEGGVDANNSADLSIAKDALSKNFTETIVKHSGNFEKFDAACVIDELISKM